MSYYQLISIMPKSSVDPDAQAFITAAGITNPTQQQAINKLVVDLKGYGIWSKMKAIYPFVGGTASTHKWNLKDPRDLDAAFRLVFTGGWTHSITGAQPNGTNGYADTKLNVNSVLTLNNTHTSIYSRTNNTVGGVDFGCTDATAQAMRMHLKWTDNNGYYDMYNGTTNRITYSMASTNSTGLFVSNRTSNVLFNIWRNSTKLSTSTTAQSGLIPNKIIFIGADNGSSGGNPTIQFYSNRQYAFASIGDGLTDTEASNLYTAVQTYQTTLGRSIGTQTVSDPDAQAFVTAANIQDQVQATAVNNLTIGLKADGLWSKMRAIYPFVGGDASSHRFNLKDPRDLDAAFRLVFNGGWTHSATGALPNGTNAYADTKLSQSAVLSQNSVHLSYYSRTNISQVVVEMGGRDNNDFTGTSLVIGRNLSNAEYRINANNTGYATFTDTNSLGLMTISRTASNLSKGYRNGILRNTSSIVSNGISSAIIFIASNNLGVNNPAAYSSKEVAFSSIGDGLTDTEASNLYTLVQNYQVALSRNV